MESHSGHPTRGCIPRSPLLLDCRPPRALPTETKIESEPSQSKSGTSVNLSKSGDLERRAPAVSEGVAMLCQLPNKLVNLLFTITHQNVKLTVLWGELNV